MTWQEHLRTQGYTQFSTLIPQHVVGPALKAIELDLMTNYEPERQSEYDNQSFCPAIRASPPIMNLILQPSVQKILDDLFGLDQLGWSNGQIAIRRARNYHTAVPPTAHIDGFSSGLNGVDEGKIYNHTVLLGIFLTPVSTEFGGNFTVWPGSHYIYESYFRERGRRAMSEPSPSLAIGEPVQLMCEVGDVVLAHYQLGHSAAVNVTDSDRIAVYFRIWLRRMELDRWHYLTNIWEGWHL